MSAQNIPDTKANPAISLPTLLVVFLFLWSQLLFQLLFTSIKTSASDLTIQNILTAVNKERGIRNLVTLSTDSRLTSAAVFKAQDMVDRKYFAHVDPDGNYIWPKIIAAGYTPYLQLGENLAIDFSSTESLMTAWMNSPTHRANILQEGFRDQGMGVSFGNTQDGQYESSIANTFGALAVSKQPTTATKTTTTQTTQKQPPITKPTTNPSPAPAPAQPQPTQSTTPAPAKTNPVVALRGEGGQTPNFTVAASPANSSTTPKASGTQPAAMETSYTPISEQGLDIYKINRYIILGFGILILIMLGGDLKEFVKKQSGKLDKKINNILILLISLIVAALLYWF